ncbi:MAG: ribulose-phosphate 3-epimerase [Oscillospiraceae bacterium]
MIIVSPSILGADFSNLGNEISKVKNAQMLHIDVMDGHFVPNISIGIPVVKSINQFCDMFLDVHLMITNPIDYVEDFADAGADLICFHLESSSNVSDTIKKIRACGKKVGISLKPNTSADKIFPYINDIDMALVMTVEPGFGGQSFMFDMMKKITQIRAFANKTNKKLDIQVDGGINLETGRLCVDAGANVLVAGSFLFNNENPFDMVEALKSL